MALPTGSRLAANPRAAGRYMTDAVWTVVERLEGFAAEHGHNLLELAFGWLLTRPAVASVIAGATTPEQVAANAEAAAAWRLTPERDAGARPADRAVSAGGRVIPAERGLYRSRF